MHAASTRYAREQRAVSVTPGVEGRAPPFIFGTVDMRTICLCQVSVTAGVYGMFSWPWRRRKAKQIKTDTLSPSEVEQVASQDNLFFYWMRWIGVRDKKVEVHLELSQHSWCFVLVQWALQKQIIQNLSRSDIKSTWKIISISAKWNHEAGGQDDENRLYIMFFLMSAEVPKYILEIYSRTLQNDTAWVEYSKQSRWETHIFSLTVFDEWN